MQPPLNTLADSIANQRDSLKDMLRDPLARIARECSDAWNDRQKLDAVLTDALASLPMCKYMYALDTNAIQISDNISRDGLIEKDFGRDRSSRPYMNERVPSAGFLLSQAYISLRARRPSLTAIQNVRDASGRVLGFVGADFDLRNLPLTGKLYDEPTHWRQIKGDPAIRGTVFHQTRSNSLMDNHIDTVLGVMEELMVDHGVFHGKLHFSSSRATLWLASDPMRYRVHVLDEILSPEVCLAYPTAPYTPEACVTPDRIRPALLKLKELRDEDENIYLRAGSINVVNGLVGLNFSCDGSHYLPVEEFLSRDARFWF